MGRHAKASSAGSTLGTGKSRVRIGRVLVCLVALLAFAGSSAPTAGAAPKSLLFTIGSGTAGTEGGLFTGVRGVAVNQSTGDLYVADGGNHRIQQFTAKGDFIRAWGTDVITTGAPNDNGTGFEICDTTAPTPNTKAQCKAGTFNTPVAGAAGQVAGPQGIAIDPTNGYLYVASNVNRRVDVFSPSGAFAGAFGWDVANTGDPGETAPTNQFEVCTTVCKTAAAAGPEAGRISSLSLTDPFIDPSAPPGTIYVPDSGANLRVNKYATTISGGKLTSATFLKAFGWDVATEAVSEEQEVRVRASAGQFKLGFGPDTTVDIAFNASAAEVQAALNALPSISTGGGSVTVSGGVGNASGSNLYVVRFDGVPLAGTDVAALTTASGTTPLSGGTPSSGATVTTRANGGTSTGLESCTTASGCKAGVSGGGMGQFVSSASPASTSVDSTGTVYVASGPLQLATNNCAPATPCRIYKFDPTTSSASILGPDVTAGKVGEVAALDVAVDPSNDHVLVSRRVAATSYQIFEYDSTGTLVETHPASPLTSASLTASHALEVGTGGRFYAGQTGTSIHVLGEVPKPPPPVVQPVTDITATGAKFHGEVTVATFGPTGFDTSWRFEYSSNGAKWTSVPVPDVALGSTPGTFSVERSTTGLEPNTEYVVRLAAITSSGIARSEVAEFTTATDAPGIDSVFSEPVSQTEAILGAEIDANHLATTYHFEWGTEAGVYPNRVPAFERHIGSGSSAVLANEGVSGLQPATTYHFRVIAENAAGKSVSGDQQLLTLNSSGLPGRGVELVSPANKRPVGRVETVLTGVERYYQAAEDGDGVAYPILNGIDSSTSGATVVQRALRGAEGWDNSQVSAPALVPAPVTGANFDAQTSFVRYFSPNLDCALIESQNPLTPDTPAVDVENGVSNLYRWNADDGSYTLLTSKSPVNPEIGMQIGDLPHYLVAGASADCSRFYFRTKFYSYFSFPNATRLYEWEGGVLRDAGRRPDGSPIPPDADGQDGDEIPEGVPKGRSGINIERNTVSRNGRLFFMGESNEGADSGKRAIFVRKGPGEVVNASQPAPTSLNPTLGSRYETASKDGSSVTFLANYGLTSAASNGPVENCIAVMEPKTKACDLYRYDVDADTLTNLSASTDPGNPRGAVVLGVLDVSWDGSVVYFAARGQLVPGKGRTYSENLSGSEFANIYRYEEGQLSFVATIDADSLGRTGSSSALIHYHEDWVARTTRPGDYLLFASRENYEGKNPGNFLQAYLYSAESGKTVCVSCPKDRAPTEHAVIMSQLGRGMQVATGGNDSPRSLSEDGRVFFESRDPLVPGAIKGKNDFFNSTINLYEWHRGQLSVLASGRIGLVDTSADGDDVFIRSLDSLVPEDIDFAPDIYDIRAGSVTPSPVVPEVPCDPAADQCQGAPTPPPGAAGTTPSSEFNGSGNPAPEQPKRPKCGKGKVLKKGKCVKKPSKKKKKAKAQGKARAAGKNLGGAK